MAQISFVTFTDEQNKSFKSWCSTF